LSPFFAAFGVVMSGIYYSVAGTLLAIQKN